MQTKKDQTYCCVPQCRSNGTRNPDLSFHAFPNAKVAGDMGKLNSIRRKRWILALKIGKEVTNRMKVCSKHFKEDDYFRAQNPQRRHLKKNAVPSLNLPVLLSGDINNLPEKKKDTEKKAPRCVSRKNSSKVLAEDMETSQVPTVAPIADSILSSNDQVLVNEEKCTNTNEMHFSAEPNLEQIRGMISNFAKERNWDQYHQPRNLLLAMVGEVGELSEIFQWKGEVKEGLPGWSEEEKEHLGQELSDVLVYLVRLSEKCHIDLPAAVVKKMALNAKKYPAVEAWGSSEKYTKYVNK